MKKSNNICNIEPKYSAERALEGSAERQSAIESKLDVSAWKELKEKIVEFDPDVIVLLARKMPRIAEVLGWDTFFHNKIVISDFALPWVSGEIKSGKKIAIIDDALNQGTSLKNVHNKVCPLSKDISIFVLGRRETKDMDEIKSDFGTHFTYIKDLVKNGKDGTYEKHSYKIPHAISLLAKPYEIEFPIFYASYKNNQHDAADILYYLETHLQDSIYAHDTTAAHTIDLGLARISLDLCITHLNNYKIRLYLDDTNKMVAIVPMATGYKTLVGEGCTKLRAYVKGKQKSINSYYEKLKKYSDGKKKPYPESFFSLLKVETDTRSEQFISSLEFGLTTMHILNDLFDINNAWLSTQDISMLFGSDFMKEVKDISPRMGKDWTLSDSPPKNKNKSLITPEFWRSFKGQKDNPHVLESFKIDKKGRDSVFLDFFEHLRNQKRIKNNQKSDIGEQYTSSDQQISEYPFLALRGGPTAGDMLHLFRYHWNKRGGTTYSYEETRGFLSSIIDTYVDAGSIVPVISQEGQRVYRSGESPAFDRERSNVYIAFYEACGKTVPPYPSDFNPDHFDEESQNQIFHLLEFVEKHK